MKLSIFEVVDYSIKNKLLSIKVKDSPLNKIDYLLSDIKKEENIKDFILLEEDEDKKVFLCIAKSIVKIELAYKNFSNKLVIYKISNEKYMNLLEYMENDTLQLVEDMDIINIVETMLKKAVETRTTDIHIEPLRDRLRIRFRIDGVLKELDSLNKDFLKPICSRVKILANLDIVEKRRPQDGRFSMKIFEKNIDFRVSTIPTMHGEKLEIRLLYKYQDTFNMEDLYLSEQNKEFIKKALFLNSGIIILNGPTGSGKSTSLYIMLKELNNETINISTVEDPIEYEIDGVNQVQCREDLGLGFASILKFLLRQDPDILVIGEIRDSDTAEISVKASLTGHLVLTTLHSSDSLGAVNRLLNLGIDNFMLSQVISMVISQRLVRKLCPHCKIIDEDYYKTLLSFNVDETKLKELEGKKIYKAGKCSKCFETGYIGRIPVMEIMYFNEDMKKLIMNRVDEDKIKQKARENGTTSIIEDALLKLGAGLISANEIGKLL